MHLQYITDSNGETTGVFIPINEWNKLKSKLQEIEDEGYDIPEWHKHIVRERMEKYHNNPNQSIDFNSAIDDIEKDL